MSTEANKTLVKRYLEECWARPDLGLVDELVAPSIAMYNHPFFPEGIKGAERIKRLIANIHSMIPDFWIGIDDMVAEGDRIALRWTSGGTQKGEWEDGIPPTNKQVKWTGIDIYRIVGEKIVELKEVGDGLSLLHQVQALQTWKPIS